MLKSAGWEQVDGQIGDIGMNVAGGGRASEIYDAGVTVMIVPDTPDNDPAKLALEAIAFAVRSEGIPCLYHFNPQLIGKTPKAIAIMIGAKP